MRGIAAFQRIVNQLAYDCVQNYSIAYNNYVLRL